MLFFAIAVCLSLILPLAKLDLSTALHAAAAGTCVVVFRTSYALALASGPVSLTTLIVNFSVLLSAGFGMVMYGDNLYLTQLAGIAALVVSMLLSIEKKADEKKSQGRWLLLTFLAMLGDSGISFAQRMFNATPSAGAAHMDITFSAVMYLVASRWRLRSISAISARGFAAKAALALTGVCLCMWRPLPWCSASTRRA